MSVANHALVSLATLKAYLVVQGSSQDANLERAINAATELIEQAMGGREVVSRGSLTEYHSLGPEDITPEIMVGQWPIATVTSVHESVGWPRTYDATTVLVEGTDFELVKPVGIIRRLTSGGPRQWATGSRAIRVVYSGGYKGQDGNPATAEDVPARLQQVALYVAASIFKEGDLKRWGVSSVSDAQGSVTRFMGHLPPSVKDILRGSRNYNVHRTWERAS